METETEIEDGTEGEPLYLIDVCLFVRIKTFNNISLIRYQVINILVSVNRFS